MTGAAFMAKAGDEMIVDHAGRLHEGIDDGGANEFEPARGKLFRHLDRKRGGGGNARGRLELIDLGFAVDEIPQKLREASTFFHDLQIGLGARDGALDLGAIADDAGIVHQRMDLLGVVVRYFVGLEIVESVPEMIALAQDRDPRQPGLKAVEDQLLVERAVVEFRHAPFGVVIGDVKRIFARPRAAGFAIGMQARTSRHATVCLGVVRNSSGSVMRIERPPAVKGVPASSASLARSIRISASP